MDRFKKYLQNNSDRLDTDMPPADLWESIASQTGAAKAPAKSRLIFLRTIAAASLLALSITVIKQTWFEHPKHYLAPLTVRKTSTDTLLQNHTALVLPSVPQPAIITTTPSRRKLVLQKSHARIKSDLPTNSYEHLINERAKKLSSMPVFAASPGYFNVFTNQLKKMEADEHAIKAAIVHNGYSDELMDQLIEVYQQKLSLLKRFQSAIQNMNNRLMQQGPVDSTTKPYYIRL